MARYVALIAALEGNRLVVSCTVNAVFYDGNGTYIRAPSTLADC